MQVEEATLKAAVGFGNRDSSLPGAATGFGQQQVNLTAGPATTTMPDGTVLPMWGYSCGAAVTGSTATCAPLSGASAGASTGALGGVYVLNSGSGYTSAPSVTISAPTGIAGVTSAQAAATAIVNGGKVVGFNVTSHGAGYTAAPTVILTGGGGTGAAAAASPAWSPVVIRVPAGATGGLQINLTNQLSFTPAGGAANNIPTSIVIIGQVGGGLGPECATTTASPNHANAQGMPELVYRISASRYSLHTTPVAGASRHPAGPGTAGCNRWARKSRRELRPATSLTWAGLKPEHLSARIRYASFDSSAHGPHRDAGGHHRTIRTYRGNSLPGEYERENSGGAI